MSEHIFPIVRYESMLSLCTNHMPMHVLAMSKLVGALCSS